MCDGSSDDNLPEVLAEDTMNVVREFLTKKSEEEQFCNFLNLEKSDNKTFIKDFTFNENWQLSQFWYDNETTKTLAYEAIKCTENKGAIALISCPTLYSAIKKSYDGEVHLYEFDQRFSIYGSDYCFYDYKLPNDIPDNFINYYDLVIADPPFLSNECLSKVAITVKKIAKNKIILCTGSIMENLAKTLLQVNKNEFKPKHKNNLANEFCCYSNYTLATFI